MAEGKFRYAGPEEALAGGRTLLQHTKEEKPPQLIKFYDLQPPHADVVVLFVAVFCSVRVAVFLRRRRDCETAGAWERISERRPKKGQIDMGASKLMRRGRAGGEASLGGLAAKSALKASRPGRRPCRPRPFLPPRYPRRGTLGVLVSSPRAAGQRPVVRAHFSGPRTQSARFQFRDQPSCHDATLAVLHGTWRRACPPQP